MSKSLIFLGKSFWATFYRSHWCLQSFHPAPQHWIPIKTTKLFQFSYELYTKNFFLLWKGKKINQFWYERKLEWWHKLRKLIVRTILSQIVHLNRNVRNHNFVKNKPTFDLFRGNARSGTVAKVSVKYLVQKLDDPLTNFDERVLGRLLFCLCFRFSK